MTKSEKIASVLFYSRYNPNDCPDEFLSDVKKIESEYKSIRNSTTDHIAWDKALRKAQANWVERFLGEQSRPYLHDEAKMP